MSNISESENTMLCANCGKGEEAGSDLKSCAACRLVKYCSRDCQSAHRPQHKKACKKRAKEIHDEKLFKEPPAEDCPICMERLPSLHKGRTYMACCGKVICNGCVYAFQSRALKAGRQKEDDICPFCRCPNPTTEESLKRLEKRMELNDAIATFNLGSMYRDGDYGLPRDQAKALELWHRAGELGSADAYYNIGIAYDTGDGGVEIDKKKAVHYYELAAMGGDPYARNNLGGLEVEEGNLERALKHWLIAVRDGNSDSLQNIKHMCKHGFAAKEDYAKALQLHQSYVDEIKTAQRDEAVAYKDEWKYY